MDFEQILYDKANGVATITLNRPDRMNAFTNTMIREWAQALEDARLDTEVRCVIVAGAGRAFCSGADLRGESGLPNVAGGERPPSAADRRNWLRDTVHHVPRAVALLDKPYIAAVNGPAVGAGMDMCSMADIRIASDEARFSMGYVRVGLIPGDGGCYYLPRIVGLAKALELIWTGDFIDAQEALRLGYVSQVLPAAELMPAARELAERIARGRPWPSSSPSGWSTGASSRTLSRRWRRPGRRWRSCSRRRTRARDRAPSRKSGSRSSGDSNAQRRPGRPALLRC